MHYGIAPNNAAPDTFYVLGGPGTNLGKFQDSSGSAAQMQGWAGVDASHWHKSTFNCSNLSATPSNVAMHCGDTFARGSATDPPEGYGDNWVDCLDGRFIVPSPSQPTVVRVTAALNVDAEPGADFLHFRTWGANGWTTRWSFTGTNGSGGVFPPGGIVFQETFVLTPADYAGNAVWLRWEMTSNHVVSDADGARPSYGHTQLDDVRVYFNDVLQTLDDFQPGSPVHWTPAVGSFAKAWPSLLDVDPCGNNTSPMVAFIDDGIVVPGTGGTSGNAWSYGPGGYAVTVTGGLAGPGCPLQNEIWSPPLDWPTGYDGGMLSFDVFRHLPVSNGLFYVWHVRSSTDNGTTWSPWRDEGFVAYGEAPDWLREVKNITTLLTPGLNKIQIALGVLQFDPFRGSAFGSYDPTPAPYFDNVRLVAFTCGQGPAISARAVDLFEDNFPEVGLNTAVRIDRARNLADPSSLTNTPGDDMIVTVVANRAGSALMGPPELHVRMKANPLFGPPQRVLPPGFVQIGDRISGVVTGTPANYQQTQWSFDLPDDDFFFAGDEIHYYIQAQDNLGGTTTLPNDLSAVDRFPGQISYSPLGYPSAFKIFALPNLSNFVPGAQPPILLWNDSSDPSGAAEWFSALDNLGYVHTVDYDVYSTNGPSSGVGNGLGGRATPSQLAGYRTLLYTSGDQHAYTLSAADFHPDAGNDVGLLDAWLSQGGKGLFASGNNVGWELGHLGPAGTAFCSTWLSTSVADDNVSPSIGNQTAPPVLPIAGNPLNLTADYVAAGSCTPRKGFDAVTAAGSAVRVAEFAPAGTYTWAALVYNAVAASTAKVIYSPVDFMYTNLPPGVIIPKRSPGWEQRREVLRSILTLLGHTPSSAFPAGVATPAAVPFAVRFSPNPFNPSGRIEFTLPASERVEARIFDPRGRLVKTLLNESIEAGTHWVDWDGRDAEGRAVASGVYYYELKAGEHARREKIALLK